MKNVCIGYIHEKRPYRLFIRNRLYVGKGYYLIYLLTHYLSYILFWTAWRKRTYFMWISNITKSNAYMIWHVCVSIHPLRVSFISETTKRHGMHITFAMKTLHIVKRFKNHFLSSLPGNMGAIFKEVPCAKLGEFDLKLHGEIYIVWGFFAVLNPFSLVNALRRICSRRLLKTRNFTLCHYVFYFFP